MFAILEKADDTIHRNQLFPTNEDYWSGNDYVAWVNYFPVTTTGLAL